MPKKKISLLALSLLLALLVACQKPAPAEQASSPEQVREEEVRSSDQLLVSAAASLKESMEELAGLYQEETGVRVRLNLGSSGALQKQIEEGAPADVFISAGQPQMNGLVDQGLVEEDQVQDLLSNQLALIQPADAQPKIQKLEDLKNLEGRLALAETLTVPAGQYSRQSLENAGLWQDLEDRLVLAKDVKAALAYVEQGEVAAGFVFLSDANQAKNSVLALVVDDQLHDPIRYPAGLLAGSSNQAQGQDFLEFLRTEPARAIFEKYGFGLVDQ